MPLITLTYATPAPATDPALKRRLAQAVVDLSTTILHKDPKVTAILVTQADAADWFCGGQSLVEAARASIWLDIHITEGTNTKDEKAAFIAQAFARLGDVLGPLHEESYIHVHEVRGDAYGFGGRTQDWRYIARQVQAEATRAA